MSALPACSPAAPAGLPSAVQPHASPWHPCLPTDNEAKQLLANNDFADIVRSEQQKYREFGVSSVPTSIINDKYAISGGQAAATFKQALEQISAEAESA